MLLDTQVCIQTILPGVKKPGIASNVCSVSKSMDDALRLRAASCLILSSMPSASYSSSCWDSWTSQVGHNPDGEIGGLTAEVSEDTVSGDSERSDNSMLFWLDGRGEGLGLGFLLGTTGNAKIALGRSFEPSFEGVVCLWRKRNSKISFNWPVQSKQDFPSLSWICVRLLVRNSMYRLEESYVWLNTYSSTIVDRP